MTKLLSVAWIFVVACGGGGGGGGGAQDANNGDATLGADAQGDAASACPKGGAAVTCGTTTPPTVPATGTVTCDPLAQSGCGASEQCTWIVDQATPTVIGHIGCAPRGNVAAGCACSHGAPGATGYDDCAPGNACVSGVCKPICDLQGGVPSCGTTAVCAAYQNLFTSGTTRVAGVCDPSCDPLTQCAATQTPDACGSTNPAMPNRGCYGYEAFGCATVLANALALTDRAPPAAMVLNGCAPGFMPVLYSMTGSTSAVCNGLCAALETDNTAAHSGNVKGDPNALGKLPTDPRPVAGHATCEPGIKGSEPTSMCRFMWQYVADDTGAIPPSFMPQVDTLGICLGITHYKYDSNNDTVPDTQYPDCAMLPPRSAATTGSFDDAADFGCQKLAHSMVTGRAAPPDLRIGDLERVPVMRHDWR